MIHYVAIALSLVASSSGLADAGDMDDLNAVLNEPVVSGVSRTSCAIPAMA